jgi:alkylation response protein AidB-like acyl-CoA dehydrogenase
VDSNLGLSPATEGQVLRLRIPELNEERRKELMELDARLNARNAERRERFKALAATDAEKIKLSKITLADLASGAAFHAFDPTKETADYLRQRQAFGKPLLDNQFIQYKLAELKTELEALRALIYVATHTYVNGGDVVELASMAKLKAGRLSRDIADWCMQFQGGMGYTWDNPVSRAYRDYRLGSIGGGADEVMLMVIARHMGLMAH